LDDLIARRKMLKAERLKTREEQEDQVANLDNAFGQFSELLQYRDKKKERRDEELRRANKETSGGDGDGMADWDVEMKQYMYERKVQASDRTKTPEEIAKEQADRLHQLETRRLARMQGDFDDDDLSDISDGESGKRNKRSKRKQKTSKKNQGKSADELDDDEESDDENDKDHLEPRFTGEGIVYVNKKGHVVDTSSNNEASNNFQKKNSDEGDDNDAESEGNDEEDLDQVDDVNSDEEQDMEEADSEDDEKGDHANSLNPTALAVGTKVQGNYRVQEQYEGNGIWYEGVVAKVHVQPDGSVRYDLEYEDGDFEEDMKPENVVPVGKTAAEREKEEAKKAEESALKLKHRMAKEKARYVALIRLSTTLTVAAWCLKL
jgi:nucleolar protein 14